MSKSYEIFCDIVDRRFSSIDKNNKHKEIFEQQKHFLKTINSHKWGGSAEKYNFSDLYRINLLEINTELLLNLINQISSLQSELKQVKESLNHLQLIQLKEEKH